MSCCNLHNQQSSGEHGDPPLQQTVVYCLFRSRVSLLVGLSLFLFLLGTPAIAQENTTPQATPTPAIDNATWLPSDVSRHILAIYREGQAFGNRATVFSKVGDSITVSRNFLYPFGVGRYDLAHYAYLQDIITYYGADNAHIGNSFINESVAAREGWRSDHVLDPNRRDQRYCEPNEMPLVCEYRLVRPSIAIIMLGTNDVGFRPTEAILQDMETIVHFTAELGIIPVVTTIPMRPDVPERVIEYNRGLHHLANEQAIPIIALYDYTSSLPNYGLTTDNVHLSSSPYGMTGTATFNAENLQYGYVMRNLATLDMLYRIHTLISTQG